MLVSLRPIPIVVISREVVAVSLCDLQISIGHRRVLGRILYLGLFAVLTFDQRLVSQSILLPNSSSKQLKVGDDITLLGLDDQHQLIQKQTKISSISGIRTLQSDNPPRWRITNTEGIFLLDCEQYHGGGYLVDPSDNSVVALWISVGTHDSEGEYSRYMTGLNFDDYVHPIIEILAQGKVPLSRCPGFEFSRINIGTATDLGLSSSRAMQIDNIAKTIGAPPCPLVVTRNLRPDHSEETESFHIGDILLEINGRCVGRMLDVQCFRNLGEVSVVVLRNGKEMGFTVYPQKVEDEIIPRILYWGGAALHQTHGAVLEEMPHETLNVLKRHGVTDPMSMVYVGSMAGGSPAIDNIQPVKWILEVGEKEIRSLDGLLEAVKGLEIGEDEEVRVKMLDIKGTTEIKSLKPCPTFWPTWIWEKQGDEWIGSEM
jgi:pro-apoptotic serine protease NMA111